MYKIDDYWPAGGLKPAMIKGPISKSLAAMHGRTLKSSELEVGLRSPSSVLFACLKSSVLLLFWADKHSRAFISWRLWVNCIWDAENKEKE